MPLQVENIQKVYYSGDVGIESVSFSLEKSDVVAFVGPNGAGKTTLINTIVGDFLFSRGRIRSYGKELNLRRLSDYRYIRDSENLFGFLTVEETFTLFGPSSKSEVDFWVTNFDLVGKNVV